MLLSWLRVDQLEDSRHPRRQVDVVLNENSQHKSLSAVTVYFRDPGRAVLFGETALARPHLAVQYSRELLGSITKPESRACTTSISRSKKIDRAGAACRIAPQKGSAEELNVMLLTYLKLHAQDHMDIQPRRRLLSAAAIAGLEVRP